MSKMSHNEAGRLGAIRTKEVWLERYEANPRFCEQCKCKLSYDKRKNRFCGHSCAASFNNVGVCRNQHGKPENLVFTVKCEIRKKPGPKPKPPRFCKFCENQINVTARGFCSHKCASNFDWKLRKDKILETGVAESKTIAKRFLLEQHGCKCETCHITEWMGQPLTLILDHINGNSDDWSIDNLRLICSNCDTLTPTYKGRNKGNGRYKRRVRYREGKSF